MESRPKTWIVCPCYFDAPLFMQVREGALSSLGTGVTFILVDDSAGLDPEVSSLAGNLPDVRIVRPPYNLGHQGALVYALRLLAATAGPEDIVVTMDSDGEDRPDDIPVLIAPLLAQPVRLDLVCIARRTRRVRSPAFNFAYALFKAGFRAATGTVIQSGNFAACRGRMLGDVINHPHFDQCYSSSLLSLPLSRSMVPLARGARYMGRSKMGFWGLVTHGVRMLMPFTERIAVRGLLASALAAALFLVLSIAAFSLDPGLRPAAFIVGCVGLFASLVLLAVFLLLFATISQAKSHSLRGLGGRLGGPMN
jgi:polyisoprenyl-phosphate glycosyltransferase